MSIGPFLHYFIMSTISTLMYPFMLYAKWRFNKYDKKLLSKISSGDMSAEEAHELMKSSLDLSSMMGRSLWCLGGAGPSYGILEKVNDTLTSHIPLLREVAYPRAQLSAGEDLE